MRPRTVRMAQIVSVSLLKSQHFPRGGRSRTPQLFGFSVVSNTSCRIPFYQHEHFTLNGWVYNTVYYLLKHFFNIQSEKFAKRISRGPGINSCTRAQPNLSKALVLCMSVVLESITKHNSANNIIRPRFGQPSICIAIYFRDGLTEGHVYRPDSAVAPRPLARVLHICV